MVHMINSWHLAPATEASLRSSDWFWTC